MIHLPCANPIKEKIDPGRINLPDALHKLRSGSFTGYLRFDAAQATGIIIFEQGRLISALCEDKENRQISGAALAWIFGLSLRGGANLDIFRLSSDLALSIHVLLHGRLLYRGQEVKHIDIKSLLGVMKEEKLNGCLRIYTQEHMTFIFYRLGNPLGFFHDGSTALETTVDTSMSVARLPGARIDVLTTTADEEQLLVDLLKSTDISKLWNEEVEKVASLRLQKAESAQSMSIGREKLFQLFRAVVETHLGENGVALMEREFGKIPVFNDATFEQFYAAVARSAKLVAGPSRIQLMLSDMRRAVRSALTPQ